MGRLNWYSKFEVYYVGGKSTLLGLDIDKVSLFKLVDYGQEFGSYEANDFHSYCKIPGKDVYEMSSLLGFDDSLVVYVQRGTMKKPQVHTSASTMPINPIAQPSFQPISPIAQSSSLIDNPSALSTPNRISKSTTIKHVLDVDDGVNLVASENEPTPPKRIRKLTARNQIPFVVEHEVNLAANEYEVNIVGNEHEIGSCGSDKESSDSEGFEYDESYKCDLGPDDGSDRDDEGFQLLI
ncbi:hypothetical protein QVD17_16158 [Tagetes erecta]|uniref:Uncharacterized protein n=1 Tax=Tagetes erecta TaxID=13708 RepID=A0AAD8P098_TARER|nr:hypothetical protein QVD17_16158 [Tagetes erecta]